MYGSDHSVLGSTFEACVLIKSFTSDDVAFGFDYKNNAMTPDTTGAAAEVPLK